VTTLGRLPDKKLARDFIKVIGTVGVAWPLTAQSQRSAMPVIGLLGGAFPDWYAARLRTFREGLGETGHVEGTM
jgi:hypothetical protein